MNGTEPNWQQQSARRLPGPRFGAHFSRHPLTQHLVFFGGLSPWHGHLNDTWLLDQDEWKSDDSLEVTPAARAHMGMSYDYRRQTLIVFGGAGDEALLGDTWTFDGHVWIEQHPSPAPARRAHVCMAYDSARGHSLLFGGSGGSGRSPALYDDTWVWDGSSWLQQSPAVSPQPRFGACVVYDAAREAVILFGGCGRAGFPLDDAWAWSGSSWSECNPIHRPCPRAYAAMTYDEANQQVILFGGQGMEGATNDTWLWDGHDWMQAEPKNRPPAAAGYYPQLGYDPTRKSVVLFATMQNKEVTPTGMQYAAWSEVWLWH